MLRTKTGLPKHCSWNLDREDGKRRVRFRWHGFSTYLTGTPWSEDFMRQYAAALDGVKAQATNVGAKRTIPGSFDALCVSYYRSPEFRGLKASTQAVRRNVIERFRNEHGTKPIARLGRAHSDVVRMGWQYRKGDEIAVRQQKTDEPLLIPMVPELMQALAAV